MKKILISILILSASTVYPQGESKVEENDSIAIEIVNLPDSGAVGVPSGKIVSKEISPSGGRIVSEDGRVELIFPEGALKETTTISIQPIDNLLPNGNGKGYRFEPSGIKFAKPVELTFHYTKEDELSCPPILMFMALQDHYGKWTYMDYEDWDSTKRILTGSILHFSQMVNGNLARLSDEKLELKVGKSHEFKLFIVNPPPATTDPGDDEIPSLPRIVPLGDENTKWSVNGKAGGSPKYGSIAPHKDRATAKYTAPTGMIADDFVSVKVETYIVVPDDKVTRGRKKSKMIKLGTKREYLSEFECKVKLYDEYKITIKVAGKSILECNAELEDISSYDVKVYPKKVVLGTPDNGPPTLTRQANCKPLKYDVAGCIGPVHVNTKMIEKSEVSSGYPAEVILQFTSIPVRVIKISGKYPEEKHEPVDSGMDVNVGNTIKFKANRTEQKTTVGGQHGYTLTVSPI